jgi:hypothetical protein
MLTRISGRARPRSAALLIVLGLCLLGCGGGPASDGPGDSPAEPAALLPGSDDLPGWVRSTEPEVFNVDTLYEYINGQAPLFLDYGFQDVATAEYTVTADDRSLVVDIYRMAGPEEAFGIFAAERTPGDRPADVGVDGYAGSNVLNFWKGPYYVKLVSYTSGNDTGDVLLQVARSVAARIPGRFGPPPLFDLLPAKHRVYGSERFIPRAFLGQSYLTRGYQVDYDHDGMTYRCVLVDAGSTDAAVEALERYVAFLESQGRAVVREQDDPPLIVARGATTSVLFTGGGFFAGVMESRDPDTATGAAIEFAGTLTKQGRL